MNEQVVSNRKVQLNKENEVRALVLKKIQTSPLQQCGPVQYQPSQINYGDKHY